MLRGLVIGLSFLLALGCARSQPTATPTAEETLRTEMCDAVPYVYAPSGHDYFSTWISDSGISLYWEDSGPGFLEPTPGDSADDWMRGAQIWGWSYHRSTPAFASPFPERWGEINEFATRYLVEICQDERDAWPPYSTDTSGCDVWHDEVSMGTLNTTRIWDGFTLKPSAPPPDLVYITFIYVLLSDLAIDVLLEDDLFGSEIAWEMSINAVEVASSLCGFDIPAHLADAFGRTTE